MKNYTKKEILEAEQRRIFKTKDNIEILKNNIKKVIRNYSIEQQNRKELTEEEQEDLKRLYSTVIAKLNEMFYGYNVTITKEVLREQGIKIPKEGIIGIMNLNHLHYYEAMLYKYFIALKDNDSLNNDSFIKIAADIGLRANQYFQEQYNDYPIDNLIKVALIEQESKNEKSELKEIKRLKSEIRELKQTIKILEKENYYGKENNSARIRNKKAKNNLAYNLKKIPGVFKPYGLTITLIERNLFKGLYGKSLSSINKNLTDLDIDFTGNEIFKFMDDNHIEVIKCAINDLAEYVFYKQGISFNTLKTDLFDMAFVCGVSAKETLKQKLGKKTSLYNDLLKKVSKNYEDEFLEQEYLDRLEKEKFELEQQKFIETESYMYHDEFLDDLLETDENITEELRPIHR